jgi:NADP-dependent 3-hydroxy acid dehydrogenase YdfG
MARVLITGTSTGVGRATALELADRGHPVIATARRPETIADLPVTQRLHLDVTDQASVNAALESAGPIDVLVANAGETLFGSVEGTPIEEFERLFQINTIEALRVAQAVLPQMRERNAGRLIFVSSIAGRIALPLASAYAQSKWALEAIASRNTRRAWRRETLGSESTTSQSSCQHRRGAACRLPGPPHA